MISTASARALRRSTRRCDWMTCATESPTRRTGFSAVIGSWKTMLTCEPRTRFNSRLESPTSETSPRRMLPPTCDAGGRRPRTERQVMGLPDPLSPTRPNASPGEIANETPRTTGVRPPSNATVRSSTLRPPALAIDTADVVGETVAEEAEEEPDDDDCETGEEDEPRGGRDEVSSVRDHHAPFRLRRLHAETEEPERGARDDVQHEVAHREHDRGSDDVRQHVAKHEARPGVAEAVRRHDVVAPLRAERLAADDPRVSDPAHDGDRDVEIAEARAEHRHDRDDQDEEGEGREDVDQPADHRVEPAAVIAGEQPHDRADDERNRHADDADLQVDPGREDDAREDVLAQLVGAEQMCPARPLQPRRKILLVRRVRRDQRRKHRDEADRYHPGDADPPRPAGARREAPGGAGAAGRKTDRVVRHVDFSSTRGSKKT